MEYGHFDDARREYVIRRPDTPYPWINYLGAEAFFTLCSNTAGGYSFCRDARLLRLTRYRYNNAPADMGGNYFYINEGGDVWNPGWMPCRAPLDTYECRHGLGYTVIEGARRGLRARQEMLVPLGANALVTRVTLTNESAAEKRLSLFGFVEFCLWDAQDDASNFQRNFSCGEVEIERGGREIYHVTEYRERRNHYAVYAVNADVAGFDTDREAFVGLYNGFDAPRAALRGQCTGSVASGWSPVAAQQIDVRLSPGQSASYLFVLGFCENAREEKFTSPGVCNKAPARALLGAFATDAQFDAALQALRAYWDGLLSVFQADTGDARVDRMANIWNQYQCMVTFNMSRSASYFESGIGRGMGFRDSSQDLLGFVHLVPARARARILDIAATQLPDGTAYHQYQPLTKRGNAAVGGGFNDDPLWLIAGVAAYIKETGDFDILDEIVPFDNSDTDSAPLLEHLVRAYRCTAQRLGPQGLPLIGHADWNDCLNLNCFSLHPGESFQTLSSRDTGIAQSVFIAAMVVYVSDDFALLCQRRGREDEAAFARAEKARMTRAVLDAGWDGRWFLRAYDALGGKVGSSACDEGQIYIEPQGFCVMAGIGVQTGQAQQALDSVRERLLCEHGVALVAPPYASYHPELGEISSYPPGYKENGAVFCHNNPWIVMAETVLGHGDRAFDTYRRTCPAFITDQTLHRTEPYVYAQMIAGPGAPRMGEAKNSWLTGTAAWTFYCLSQSILGVKPAFDGLVIDPCLPACMPDVRIVRAFRGNTYRIHIINRSGGQKGRLSMTVNGAPARGNIVRAEGAGRVVDVEVTSE